MQMIWPEKTPLCKRKFIAVCYISNVIGYKLSNLSFSVAQPDLRPFAPVNLSRVHDKDFFLSFLKSYIVEAFCDFFGIEEITDRPTVNVPDDPNDTNCVQSKMDEFIDKYKCLKNSYILNPVEAQHGHNV
jgi:hypothetical protein